MANFKTKKTSYAPITISAAEIAQANASAREIYDALGAETDALLAAAMARDAEYFFGTPVATTTDPLDVEYDGVMLKTLLKRDEYNRTDLIDRNPAPWNERFTFTPAQRIAISAHWSAELRAKVAATKQTERAQLACERDEDGL